MNGIEGMVVGSASGCCLDFFAGGVSFGEDSCRGDLRFRGLHAINISIVKLESRETYIVTGFKIGSRSEELKFVSISIPRERQNWLEIRTNLTDSSC